MIVYGNSLSPFVRKVLAFASEKAIEVELVAAGMGVAIIPQLATQRPRARVCYLPFTSPSPGRELALIIRQTGQDHRDAQSLTAFLRRTIVKSEA